MWYTIDIEFIVIYPKDCDIYCKVKSSKNMIYGTKVYIQGSVRIEIKLCDSVVKEILFISMECNI